MKFLEAKPNILLFLCFLFFCSACASNSDDTKELSGGYFLRLEGPETNDILSHLPNQREIPSNVLSYNYNKDFIIASQKPNATDDPLYTKTTYIHGRSKVYYWLIIHSKKIVLGPLDTNEFQAALKIYAVPLSLKLRSLE